ncbi:MAG: lysophospholipid acyltransferase family protein [Gemmatimonadaceae bacterium]
MLIKAAKLPMLERAYARYGRRLLRHGFACVRLGGAPWPAGTAPTIAYINHSAWWDPILAHFLADTTLGLDAYGIMHGAGLQRYPFFRRIGCFGVTTAAPADTRALAAYAAELLRAPPASRGRSVAPRTLWIFPQGELLPARVPLAFRSGLARLARAVPEARLVPVAVRYEFRADQRPECVVRFGDAEAAGGGGASPAALTTHLEARLRAELAALDAELASLGGAGPPGGYPVILDGARSLDRLYDRTWGRWG